VDLKHFTACLSAVSLYNETKAKVDLTGMEIHEEYTVSNFIKTLYEGTIGEWQPVWDLN
jgi:hypothetical protein